MAKSSRHRLPPDDDRLSFPLISDSREPFGCGPAATTLPTDLALKALDLLALGVVLVDEGLGCVFANRAARMILRHGPVVIAGSKLVCVPRQLCLTLHRAVRRLLTPVGAPCVKAEVVLAPAEPEPLRLILTALHAPEPTMVALFTAPPARRRQFDAELLHQLFGLTRMETEISELLCRGLTPREIARELRFSPHTARAHLRAVFAKTGARRQSDLVRMMLSDAGALWL